MKFLLVAINAKYIHSNLGIYSLKAYAEKKLREVASGQVQVEIAEYTINHQMDQILQDIYRRKPDVIGFSCYIWNIQYIRPFLKDIPKVLPDVKIWMGGPEVYYRAESFLKEEPTVTGVMVGEGEATLAELDRTHLQWWIPRRFLLRRRLRSSQSFHSYPDIHALLWSDLGVRTC